MEKMRISKWCKLIELGDFTAFYHSLSMAILYLPAMAAEKLIQILKQSDQGLLNELFDENTLEALRSENIIIAKTANEDEELFFIRELLLKNVTLDMMYLILSDNCNLQCRYCFEDAPSQGKFFTGTNMNNKTVENAIEYFANLTQIYGNDQRGKIIHLYGGEPLLNFDAINTAVKKINDLKAKGKFSTDVDMVLITNGILLTDEVADFIAEQKIRVGISIDGPENLHNIHRVGKMGNINSFQRACEAYERLRKRDVQTGLSATLTPEVIKNFDEVLDFFVNKLGVKDGLSFNIMHYNPAMQVDDEYFKAAAQALIRAYDLFRQKGIYEERMMRKITAFITREPMFADCGVVGSQIVVAPDGKIGVCQDFVKPRTYFQGTVNDSSRLHSIDGLFDEWKKRSPFFMKQCYECEAIAVCGGGCPASIELISGSRWNVDSRICHHSKMSLRWLILSTMLNTIN